MFTQVVEIPRPARRLPHLASTKLVANWTKVYLASRYDHLHLMQDYRALLQGAGYTVTSRWVNGDHEMYDLDVHLRHRFAEEDVEDVVAADWIINFTEPPESNTRNGGRHVELGIGIGMNKRLTIIGYRENVFHYLPQIEFYRTWNDFWPGS